MAIWPVFVVGDAMSALEFSVTCEDAGFVESAFSLQDEGEPFGEIKREYAATEVQRRIHQGVFRERVLVAYGGKCAFCTLGYRELLDAAHIIPDSELRGEPVVSNGMSLCRLHHAACGVWADDFGGSAGLHHSGADRRFGGGGWADVEARASGVGGAADIGAEQAGGSAG